MVAGSATSVTEISSGATLRLRLRMWRHAQDRESGSFLGTIKVPPQTVYRSEHTPSPVMPGSMPFIGALAFLILSFAIVQRPQDKAIFSNSCQCTRVNADVAARIMSQVSSRVVRSPC